MAGAFLHLVQRDAVEVEDDFEVGERVEGEQGVGGEPFGVQPDDGSHLAPVVVDEFAALVVHMGDGHQVSDRVTNHVGVSPSVVAGQGCPPGAPVQRPHLIPNEQLPSEARCTAR